MAAPLRLSGPLSPSLSDSTQQAVNPAPLGGDLVAVQDEAGDTRSGV